MNGKRGDKAKNAAPDMAQALCLATAVPLPDTACTGVKERAMVLVIDGDARRRRMAVELLKTLGFNEVIVCADVKALDTLSRPKNLRLALCHSAVLTGIEGLALMRWMAKLDVFCAIMTGTGVSPRSLVDLITAGRRLGLHLFGELQLPPSALTVQALVQEYSDHRHHIWSGAEAQPFSPQDIDNTLKHRRFIAHYRPLVAQHDADEQRARMEIQWKRPDGTFIAQWAFLQHFKASRHFELLFLSTANQTFALLRALKDERLQVSIILTLFPSLVLAPALPSLIAELSLRYGINPSFITFEVQEHVLNAAAATVPLNLLKLRRMGFGLCLRCSGHQVATNKDWLCRLPFNEITLNLPRAPGSPRTSAQYAHTAATWSLVTFARSLGLIVNAVINTASPDPHQLSRLGCDYVQCALKSKAQSALYLFEACRLREQHRRQQAQPAVHPDKF